MARDMKDLDRTRKFIAQVLRKAKRKGRNVFIVSDGASGTLNNGNPAVRNAREAQIKWELEHGADPDEDWSKKAADMDIESLARPHYPSSGSHGWNHIQDVLKRARSMSDMSGEEWSPDSEAAIMYHDAGLYPNGPDGPEEREDHELRSAEIARRELAKRFSKERLDRIAEAIRQHRASYEGELSSPLSDLLSSADRNPPDVLSALRRGDQWNKEHGISGREGYERVASFMAGKYGKGGYARFPSHYEDMYKDELESFRSTMSSLTPEKVEQMLSVDSKTASDNTLDEAIRRIKSHIVVNKGLDPDDVAQRVLQLHMGRIFQHIFMVKAFASMIAAKHANAKWVPKMKENVLQHDKHKWNDVEFMGDYAPYIVEEYVGSKWFHTNEGYDKVHERIGEKHRMLSDHHVDHWCPFRKYSERNDKPLVPLLMPDYAMAEMLADWMAVSFEKGTTATDWFNRNQGKKWRFTQDQVKFIESILKDEPEFRKRFKSA